MRLFIAVKLNDEIRRSVTETQNKLFQNGVRGRFSSTDNLHLTLAFIGEYNDPNYVMEALRNVSFQPFQLKLDGKIGNFDDVLWTGLERNDDLQNLADNIRKELTEYNIPFDEKTYNPHITMMRRASFGDDVFEIRADKAEMTVDSIYLMCTRRGRHGMYYEEVGNVVSDDNYE